MQLDTSVGLLHLSLVHTTRVHGARVHGVSKVNREHGAGP